MRFFEHQTRARRGTARLLVLYALAVLLTVGLLVWVCSWFFPRDADRLRYALVTAVPFAAIILGASLYRLRELSQGGGASVALSLGGQMLQDGPTATLAERRALNVVEEMALAAGVRRPALYVLPDSSINAFAAGMDGKDAVIGLTRGAIEQLDRNELQAVVAHEFSHILNGDMRLNMRLAGYLFGLQMIAVLGQYLMSDRPTHRASGRSNSSDGSGSSGGVLIVVGLACMVLGWVGALLAGWVQAAISRQREYLADASAVQFTRQTEGLAGALYKIALSPQRRLRLLNAREYAHFMFGSVDLPRVFEGLSATHPKLINRIRRVNPACAREWEQGLKMAQGWSDRHPTPGVLAMARQRQKRANAEQEAQWQAHWQGLQAQEAARMQVADALRVRILQDQPDYARRQSLLRRSASSIWLALAAKGERAPLLLHTLLAPVGVAPSAAGDGVGHALYRRLLRRPLPEACQLDLLAYLLPLAVAAHAPADLLAAADAAYRANPQPSPTQQALWQKLRAYLNEAEHFEIASDDEDEGGATVMWQPT